MRHRRRARFAALAALGVCTLMGAASGIAAQGDPPTEQDVTLVLTEYRFSPDRLTFRRGAAYRLLVENRGKELHELTAPDFFGAVALGTPNLLVQGGRDLVLQPGERKVLHFVATRAGRFPFSCADHDWAGMTGEIVIE